MKKQSSHITNGAALLSTKARQYFLKHVCMKHVDIGLFYSNGKLNIGDSMTPWLIEKVSGKKYIYSNPREARGTHLFAIGSILQYADENSVIWGSGFLASTSKVHSLPKRILAVRGPDTSDRLVALGGEPVHTFGDPAILTPEFIIPENPKENFNIGLIPHYIDVDKVKNINLWESKSKILCDVRTDSIQQFINTIIACDVVISSSLHGLILAETFGIPAIWAEFSSDVAGSGFKFKDYYRSTNRNINPVSFSDLNSKNISRHIPPPPHNLDAIKNSLMESFPYDL